MDYGPGFSQTVLPDKAHAPVHMQTEAARSTTRYTRPGIHVRPSRRSYKNFMHGPAVWQAVLSFDPYLQIFSILFSYL